MSERTWIETYLQPLARSVPESLGLLDDAALLPGPTGSEYIITTDTICDGVHFLVGTTPDCIARKLLRTNLSDCAAMGARPKYYFLSASLPSGIDHGWIAAFCGALAEEQQRFAITLCGGDTVTHSGPLTLSITLVGEVPAGQALQRSQAKIGDLICVSGTIGDAALGLQVARSQIPSHVSALSVEDSAFLQARYELPQPRIDLAAGLYHAGVRAAMDISDGLVGDLEKLCAASQVGACIKMAQIPLSGAAMSWLAQDHEAWDMILTGGDDYELLFTLNPARYTAFHAEHPDVTIIGTITSEPGVTVIDHAGGHKHLAQTAYEHL